jgi:hypothetical protein
MKNPFLSKPFWERVRLSKYAWWAAEMTEEQLLALFEAVGEYGYRSDKVLGILKKHGPRSSYSHGRATLALEVLAEFSHRNPITEEELSRRIHQVPDRAGEKLLLQLKKQRVGKVKESQGRPRT